MTWERFVDIVQRHRLLYGILLAIVIGMLLVAISMSLYVTSGASQLDLSRPGYEKARTQVNATKEDNFDSVGPINAGVISEFQKLFDKRRETIDASDNFDSSVLDDSQLRLSE